MGPAHLVAHDEGLATLVLGQQGLERLQVLGQCLHIVLLARLLSERGHCVSSSWPWPPAHPVPILCPRGCSLPSAPSQWMATRPAPPSSPHPPQAIATSSPFQRLSLLKSTLVTIIPQACKSLTGSFQIVQTPPCLDSPKSISKPAGRGLRERACCPSSSIPLPTLLRTLTEAHPASSKLLPSPQMCPVPAHFMHLKVPASLPEAPPSAPAPGSPPDLPGLRIREPPLAGRLLS